MDGPREEMEGNETRPGALVLPRSGNGRVLDTVGHPSGGIYGHKARALPRHLEFRIMMEGAEKKGGEETTESLGNVLH